jgi:hypothetical protein
MAKIAFSAAATRATWQPLAVPDLTFSRDINPKRRISLLSSKTASHDDQTNWKNLQQQ